MTFGMTDLEERLLSDDSTAVRTEALKRVGALFERLETARKAGLSPDDYRRSETLVSALVAARSILVTFPLPKENRP